MSLLPIQADRLLGCHLIQQLTTTTLPETNSKFAPENGWLEVDFFLLGRKQAYVQVQTCWLRFREGNPPRYAENILPTFQRVNGRPSVVAAS